MYTAVYMEFGKQLFEEKGGVFFEEKEVVDLDDLNLFNYTMDENELGKVFYLVHYGGDEGNYGYYLVVVRSGDEESVQKAKETLKKEAMKNIKKRMDKDNEVYKMLEENML